MLLDMEGDLSMDINCTDECHYQRDGKCTLYELPDFTQSAQSGNTGCFYQVLPRT